VGPCESGEIGSHLRALAGIVLWQIGEPDGRSERIRARVEVADRLTWEGDAMASDQYLQIDGIKGESTDSQHKDWIEVLSYSQSAGAAAPGAADAKKTSGPSDILITKKMDSSSPMLQKLCSSGKHIPKATLHVMRSGAEPATAEMSDVTVSKISPNDKAAGAPMESVTLNYGKIQWTYTQQK
jgi:type VI secretion system secreted protein Hcp